MRARATSPFLDFVRALPRSHRRQLLHVLWLVPAAWLLAGGYALVAGSV